jgi:hypothetical protein
MTHSKMTSFPSSLLASLSAALALGAAACGSGSTSPADAAPIDAVLPDGGTPDAVPGSPPEADIEVQALAFGDAPCGGEPPAAQVVTLRNGGGRTLHWSAVMRFTPSFAIEGANGGSLAPGDSIDIVVAPRSVASTVAAGQSLNDVLLVEHDDPSRGPYELPVTMTAQGASIDLSTTVVDFGAIPVGAPAPAVPIYVTNTGTTSAQVRLVTPDGSPFSATFAGGPDAVELAPGATLADALAGFTPAALAPANARATVEVTGALCGGPIPPIQLRGHGTASEVLVSPATVNFGNTTCGSTALAQPLFIANTSDEYLEWSAALDAGGDSRYSVSPSGGLIAPGDSQVLSISSEAIPAIADMDPAAYAETLTVTTSAPGDVPHTIQLAQRARGVVIAIDAASYPMDTAYELAEANASATAPITIRNLGTQTTQLTIGSDNNSFSLLGANTITLGPGAEVITALEYSPVAIASVTEQLSFSYTGVSCGDAPSASASGEARLTKPGQGGAIEALPSNGSIRRLGLTTTCVRTPSGHVACTGSPTGGMRGTSSFPDWYSVNLVSTADGPLDEVVDLGGGLDWYCADRLDGTSWCWGNLQGPELLEGNDHQVARSNQNVAWLAAQRFDGRSGLSGGGAFACGVEAAQFACVATNLNSVAQAGAFSVSDAIGGAVHSLGGYALKSNGTVWSFGSNATGERGSNVVDMAPPAAIPGLSDVVQVVAGTGGRTRSSKHGCARTTAGTVYCWGRGSRGRLGDGTGADQWSPVQVMIDGVTPLSGVTELSAGREFNCAVTADNVYCWGRGYEGQIGTGSSGEYYYATPVSPALTGVVALRSADRNTCATLDTGAVRCWGHTQGGVVYSPTPLDAFEPLAE